jgi:site-specific DNA-methyltransferase (adenine-specific)
MIDIEIGNIYTDCDINHISPMDIYHENQDVSIFKTSLYKKVIETQLNLSNITKNLLNQEDNKTTQFFIINSLFRENSAKITNLYKGILSVRDRCEKLEKTLLQLKSYRKYDGGEIDMYGDVFTNLDVVNEMLDSLPKHVWKKPKRKWFNPANGMGNYTIGVILRLMEGLKDWEKDEVKRYKHIVENMIFICELQPVNMLMYISLIDPNAEYKLNTYCGSFIDSYFDKYNKNVWGNLKFNMTFGNPPYNGSREDNNRSKDIFQQFVTKSRKISRNVLMLTPARWFIKEYYSTEFRHDMVNSFNLKYLVRYDNNKYLYGVDVKGGFCYFLLTENKNGKITINNINDKIDSRPIQLTQDKLTNFLDKHGVLPNFMDDRTFRLIRKVEKYPNINCLYNSARHFDIKTNSSRLKSEGIYKCFVSSHRGYIKYVDFVKENSKVDTFKLLIPAAAHNGKMNEDYFTRMICAYPGEVCSESFIFFNFQTEAEMLSFKSYMESEFISFLVRSRKISQHLNESIFGWVPLVLFNKIWTNEEVYKHFNISKVDIKFIKKIVK